MIRERNVDKLIETARTDKGLIKDIRSVGSSNEEKILLGTSTIHFGKELIKNTIGSATSVSHRGASSLTNGIKFIEEKYARSCTTCLVEYLTDVTFGFTEPHSQKLWSLNRDEVRRAFVGDGFG